MTAGKNKEVSKSRIQYKILAPFLLLIILTGAVIAFVSYQSSVKTTTNELTNNMETQMTGMNNTFELFFDDTENTLNRLTANDLLTEDRGSNEDDIFEYFKETADTNESIKNIYVGKEENEDVIIYPEADLESDFNAKERSWYKDAVEAEEDVVWTKPYTDAASGETIVSAAKAYYDQNDEFISVASIDVSLDTLLTMIDRSEVGDIGYAFLLDETGTYLAHPDEDLIGEDASKEDYFQNMNNIGEQGVVNETSDDEERVTAFAKNPTTGWTVGSTIDQEEFKRKAGSTLVPIAITVVVVLVLSIFVSFFVTRRITKPMRRVMHRMKNIADGDLTEEPLEVKSKDEIGQLMMTTNNMSSSIRDLLQQINQVSETVSSHSEELTQSVGEVKSGAEQIATTMQDLASGSETQANHSSELSESMTTFATRIQEVNEQGEQIRGSSGKVLEMTEEGRQLMNASSHQMNKIDQIVLDAVAQVKGLDTQSQDISKLVSVIKNIAEQTNLLALNAAIEAARAGENGKGFAVVADEVRKLAEQVSDSVSDITGIVEKIQSESSHVTNSLEEGYKEVEKGTEQIESTGEKFDGISAAVTEVTDSIKMASDKLSEIASTSQQMNSSIQEIASVTEESSAGVEQTSSSSEQTSSSMEEIAGNADNLAKLAEDLNGLVHRFKL